jgi:predicted adenylyl cyclase CyaB
MMISILTKLGFEELVTVNVVKHIYHTSEYEIVLEEVERLGLFLEVEKKAV